MDEVIKIQFEAMQKENDRQNARLKELEQDVKELKEIHVSVKLLANNMEQMLEEQKEQGERIKKMERTPADKWNTMTRTIFTSIITAVSTAAALGIVNMIVQNM